MSVVSDIIAVLVMVLGGLGLTLSIYVPHKEHFTDDHTIGSMVLGAGWAILCFVITIILLCQS